MTKSATFSILNLETTTKEVTMKYVLYSSNENADYELETWFWDNQYDFTAANNLSIREVENQPRHWTVKCDDMNGFMENLQRKEVQQLLGDFSFTMSNN